MHLKKEDIKYVCNRNLVVQKDQQDYGFVIQKYNIVGKNKNN